MRTHTTFPPRFARTLLPALVLGLTLLQLPAVQAATLGEATVRSTIGQALNAEIELTSVTNAELDSLTVRAAPAEVYAEANLDYSAVLCSLRFSLERKGEGNLIRVTSEQVVNEPFLTILFEFTTSGNRMMRQVALLLDPPALSASPVAGPVSPISPAPQMAPDLTQDAGTAPASPAVAARAADDDARLVKRGDTLARIAAQVRPEGAQLAQVLVALQRANPAAFEGRNMNRIKSGSVLIVPPADAIKSVDAVEARRLVRAQTADFARYRGRMAQLAMNPPGTLPLPANEADNAALNNRSSSGKIGVQAVEPGKETAAQDKLQLSAPDSTNRGAGDKLVPASTPWCQTTCRVSGVT